MSGNAHDRRIASRARARADIASSSSPPEETEPMTYQTVVRYLGFAFGAAAIVAAVVPGGQALAAAFAGVATLAAVESRGRQPKAPK